MPKSAEMTTTVRIDLLLEALPDPAFICDAKTSRFLAVNQRAIDKYGYSRAEFLHMNLSGLSSSEEGKRLEKRLAASGPDARVQERCAHQLANGDMIHVDLSVCAIAQDGKQMMLVVARDASLKPGAASQLRLLETSLERLNDIVLITEADEIDPPGPRIVYANDAFVRRTGYSREEVIGETPRVLQGARTQRRELDRIRKALKENRPVRAELINYTKSGEEFWIELNISPVTDNSGKVTHFVAVQRDVTGRIASMQELAESKERFSAVAEATSDIIWDWDIKENVVWWSKSYATVFGHTLVDPKADPQTSWLERIHPDDRERVFESAKIALEKKKKHWQETYRFIHSNGREIPVAHRGTVILDEEGNPAHFVGGLVMLNEHDRADPRLQQIAARLGHQVELAQMLTSASQENEKHLHSMITAAAQSLLEADGAVLGLIQGKSFAYVAGQGIGAARNSTAIPIADSFAAVAIERGQSVVCEDVEADSRWTSDAWQGTGVNSALATILHGAEGPIAVLKVLSEKKRAFSEEDIRSLELFAQSASAVLERRQLEMRLRNSQRLQSLGQLTGGIAHDFNNLLTVILGNADSLAAKFAEDPEVLQIADLTRAAAERGAGLTNRLLAFARQQPLDPKSADLNKLVAGMDDLLRRTLGSNIEIEVVRGAGLWNALIDSVQLESALLNLSINARDAMPDGGKLIIELANTHLGEEYADKEEEVLPGQYVMVAVSDTGTGMSPETISRVFDPFFTTKAPGRGSGLGLSMVFGFVKQSRGHIKVYSEPGQGTTVRLYLPRATPYASTGQAVSADPEKCSNIKILLVEDDDLVRGHILSQLRALGYMVVEARNGREALEAVRQISDFDLLFTDVVMPGGMTGKEVADEVLKLRPAIKVLFTSGYTQNAIVHGGKLDPGVNFISKPFRQADIERKINQIFAAETEKP